MNDNLRRKRGWPRVIARTGDGLLIIATGREGETLLQLVERGAKGVRAYDFPGGPPFRLAAYICDLRAMGLAISTASEPHAGGWHARYLLETPLVISRIETGMAA
jgi:hypothetical protein